MRLGIERLRFLGCGRAGIPKARQADGRMRPAGFGFCHDEAVMHGRDPSVVLELRTPCMGEIVTTVQKGKEWVDQSIRFM